MNDRFSDLSHVRLKRAIEVHGVPMPAGSLGMVVGEYTDRFAYEVEFSSPHAILTVDEADLEACDE